MFRVFKGSLTELRPLEPSAVTKAARFPLSSQIQLVANQTTSSLPLDSSTTVLASFVLWFTNKYRTPSYTRRSSQESLSETSLSALLTVFARGAQSTGPALDNGRRFSFSFVDGSIMRAAQASSRLRVLWLGKRKHGARSASSTSNFKKRPRCEPSRSVAKTSLRVAVAMACHLNSLIQWDGEAS